MNLGGHCFSQNANLKLQGFLPYKKINLVNNFVSRASNNQNWSALFLSAYYLVFVTGPSNEKNTSNKCLIALLDIYFRNKPFCGKTSKTYCLLFLVIISISLQKVKILQPPVYSKCFQAAVTKLQFNLVHNYFLIKHYYIIYIIIILLIIKKLQANMTHPM